MSTPEAPTHPFNVYLLEGGVKGPLIGGSYDNVSAVTIACAVFQSFQSGYPSNERGVGVFDATDTALAYIGRTAF